MNNYFKLSIILFLVNISIAYLGLEIAPSKGWETLAGIYWCASAIGLLASVVHGIDEHKWK